MKQSILILTLFIFTACGGANGDLQVTLPPGDHDLQNSPVYTDVENSSFEDNTVLCADSGNEVVPAQVEKLSDDLQRIWWTASKPAAESVTYSFRANGSCYDRVFAWESAGRQSSLLRLDNQPVMQYEHPVFDPNDIEHTKKPFHHLFDPAGDQLITKGPGGLYSHHRGIFFGYNHVYINDTRIDIWHANEGERSEHEEVLKVIEGPVMGGHVVKIYWKDHDGNEFLEEKRDIRVFRQSDDVNIVDFRSVLSAVDGPVRLDGDRQHAGVQFRAPQYVADNADQTRFIRPANLAHVDSREEIEGEDMMDLPWNAMAFQVEGRPYTVAYLSHPDNPSNAEMSERLYGRFGEFFRYEVTPGNPLQVSYRFVIRSGSLTEDEIEQQYRLYAGS
jgi:hypothetical protein